MSERPQPLLSDTRVIAIDPDMRKSGVAGIEEDGEIFHLESMPMPDLIDMLNEYPQAIYAIEDVNKHGAVYQHNRRQNRAVQSRIAQNVGMVKAAGTIIIDLITDSTGRPPILAPLGLGAQVKRNAALFNRLTGWQGKSNEDTRDAACIGRWVASQLHAGWTVDEKTGQLVRPHSKK